MSQFWTDYAENQFVDLQRGQAMTLPAVTWYVGLLSAAADGSFTEVTGANLARKNIARSLAAWSGTQGAGTTTASGGTSHTSSNNADIAFGAASADLAAPVEFVGLFDASSGGNLWAYIPYPGGTLTVLSGDTPTIAAGELAFVVGEGNGCSDYLSNKLIDLWLRGQAFSYPATSYHALMTTLPANSGGGVEVGGGVGYARVAVANDMTHWSGTQSSASTSASSGTSGKSYNIGAISYGVPSGDWGAIVGGAEYDASSGGNLLTWGAFASTRSILSGAAAPSYASGTRTRSAL